MVCLDAHRDKMAGGRGAQWPLGGLSQIPKPGFLKTGFHPMILLGRHPEVQYLKVSCGLKRARGTFMRLEKCSLHSGRGGGKEGGPGTSRGEGSEVGLVL